MDPSSLPERIGPYLIEGVLGQGSSAVVLRARDAGLDRPVALKLLGKTLEPEARSRFIVEARAAGRLVHPNVVQVYAAGEHEGQAYIVQELVDGLPLSELIETRGMLSAEAVIEIGIQAAEALACAADAEVLHRDVKPQNLLVSDSGEVKLADFGVAKIAHAPSGLTEEGTTLGTPHYMSPEQGKGAALDARSDQYSLGATLYHLTTGEPPFDAENALALLLMHHTEPLTPVRARAPECPPRLARAIERMLSKAPDQRFDSFDEVIAALEASRDADAAAADEDAELDPELDATPAPQLAPAADESPIQDAQGERQKLDAWLRRAPAALAAMATTVVVGLILLADTHPNAKATRPISAQPALPSAALPTTALTAPTAPVAANPPKLDAPNATESPKLLDPPAGKQKLPGLLDALQRGGPDAIDAAHALGQLGDHQATPALLKGLASSDPRLAIASAEALAELADVRAITPLEDAARSSASPELRAAARNAERRLWHVEEEAR